MAHMRGCPEMKGNIALNMFPFISTDPTWSGREPSWIKSKKFLRFLIAT